MKDRFHRHGGLIGFVLLGVLFAGFLPRAVAGDGEVVIFSGETVVDFTGKVHALRDSTKPTPAGGKSVRLEFWRRPHSMIIGAVKGGDTFSPTEIDYSPGDFWLKFAFAPEHVAEPLTAPSSVKTPVKILQLLEEKPELSLPELAALIGKSVSAVERASAKLVKAGKLRRIGPAKGGHWEVEGKAEG
jgi:hypothetical protein